MKIMASLCCVAALVTAGCASNGQGGGAQEPQSVSDDGAGCRLERPTGSNIAREVCRSPDEVQRDREEARKLVIPPRVAPTRIPGGV